MLQVTLNTSLKLHGRTTELPSSDFNRLVIRFTRHTLQVNRFVKQGKLKSRVTQGNFTPTFPRIRT
jgi:hypothetical protein